MARPGELVSIEEARRHLDLRPDAAEEELSRYIAQATGVVQKLAGPTLIAGTFVEPAEVRGGELLLRRWPLTGAPVAAGVSGLTVLNPDIGLVGVPRGSCADGTWLTVTYDAGLPEIPAEATDAALVFVGYKYRRNHGGSESYMPAGADSQVVTPMGTRVLADQITLALGEHARGPLVGR